MRTNFLPRSCLQVLTAICLVGVALPTSNAWAQKIKNSPPEEILIPEFSLEIPTITTVDSNVDEAVIRAIFNGQLQENADALANLTAKSISIPEISFRSVATTNGKASETTSTYTNIVFTDVVDGIAASVTMAANTMAINTNLGQGEQGMTSELGTLVAENLNIGAILNAYGLVTREGQEVETLYTSFSSEGGRIAINNKMICTLNAVTGGEARIRPANYNFTEIMAIFNTIEANPSPSPKIVGTLLHFYADALSGYESEPSHLDGFDCAGISDDGHSLNFKISGASLGAMRPGIYPSVSIDGLEITVENDGVFRLDNLTLKETDISGLIATIQAAPDEITERWFEKNIRDLIPEIAGFSFTDLMIDVPDTDNKNSRFNGGIGSFDWSLADYFNGIPTAFSIRADNISATLPEDSNDEQLQLLIDLGVTHIDTGFGIDVSWNRDENQIAINDISFTGDHLATARLVGTINNATEVLFSGNAAASAIAAMMLAVDHLKLDVTDHGLIDLAFQIAAAEQGVPAETLRPVLAGLAEGTIIGLMAGMAEAQDIGGAINTFLAGKAKNLTIDLTAKKQPGINLDDFYAAEDDPASLIGKVNIKVSAE